MATYDGKFFKGSAGPVVYKKYRNLQIIQSKPEFLPGSQTKATQLAALSFGLSSRLAKAIRKNLDAVVTPFFDGRMVNRMNGDLIQIMTQAFDPKAKTFAFHTESFNRLAGFEFNINSPVRDNFFVQPELSLTGNSFKIAIPPIQLPQELRFPKDGRLCTIGLVLGMFDLKHGRMTLSPIQTFQVKWSYGPELLPARTFDFEIEPGCLCVAAISMQYTKTTFVGTMLVNNKAFNPVAIVKAFIAGGEADEARTKAWQRMEFKTG